MTSPLFEDTSRRGIEQAIVSLVNAHPTFLSAATARSPRAVGDAVEQIIGQSFQDILGNPYTDYRADFARRAMADLAFRDGEGRHHVVDIKTHRAGTRFNMPNLISVERLARFYESDLNFFAIMLVRYGVDDTTLRVTDVTFVPIEYLSWECLTIGALGWGQIQIRDTNTLTVNSDCPRPRWMMKFCDRMLSFYPSEIAKIGERMARFENVRAYWNGRADHHE